MQHASQNGGVGHWWYRSYMVVPHEGRNPSTAGSQRTVSAQQPGATEPQPPTLTSKSPHEAQAALWPVPASRASIFSDRRLSLADKRVLTRLLAAAMPGMAAAAAGAAQLQVGRRRRVG